MSWRTGYALGRRTISISVSATSLLIASVAALTYVIPRAAVQDVGAIPTLQGVVATFAVENVAPWPLGEPVYLRGESERSHARHRSELGDGELRHVGYEAVHQGQATAHSTTELDDRLLGRTRRPMCGSNDDRQSVLSDHDAFDVGGGVIEGRDDEECGHAYEETRRMRGPS